MASSWVDLSTVHNPTSNVAPPATWGDQIRENQQHLYERVERVIAHTVLGSAASSISSGTLPTVPNGWLLRVVPRLIHATANVSTGMRFNGDTGTNYYGQQVYGTGTTTAATFDSASTSLILGNASTTDVAVSDLIIPGYLSSNKKTFVGHTMSTGLGVEVLRHIGGWWTGTAPITSVQVIPSSGSFAAGSALTVLATPVPV